MASSKKVICGFCQGKGEVTLNVGARTCSSCKGKGKISLPSRVKKCNKCGGTGKIGWRKCATCRATGWI